MSIFCDYQLSLMFDYMVWLFLLFFVSAKSPKYPGYSLILWSLEQFLRAI